MFQLETNRVSINVDDFSCMFDGSLEMFTDQRGDYAILVNNVKIGLFKDFNSGEEIEKHMLTISISDKKSKYHRSDVTQIYLDQIEYLQLAKLIDIHSPTMFDNVQRLFSD